VRVSAGCGDGARIVSTLIPDGLSGTAAPRLDTDAILKTLEAHRRGGLRPSVGARAAGLPAPSRGGVPARLIVRSVATRVGSRPAVLLVAPDSFKGTYSARDVAEAIARGAGPDADPCPVADGGEGTLEVLLAGLHGHATQIATHDPLGRPMAAPLGWVDDGATAIVEMATVSGLGLVPEAERDAEAASTFGTGELIAAAIAAGARRVLVAVGGSATTDGGAGALDAIDAAGGASGAELIVLSDVTTPYERAAEVYGPQKGADADAVARLTERLDALAATLPRDPRGVPMTGAAGGLAGGLWAAYGAALAPGAARVLDALDFDARLARADAVVTGEGCLDRQTLEGKLIGEIAARCRRAGTPLHAVVGSTLLTPQEAEELGLASVQIAGDVPALEAAGRALAGG
jgi:glycerate 2-kinase